MCFVSKDLLELTQTSSKVRPAMESLGTREGYNAWSRLDAVLQRTKKIVAYSKKVGDQEARFARRFPIQHISTFLPCPSCTRASQSSMLKSLVACHGAVVAPFVFGVHCSGRPTRLCRLRHPGEILKNLST